MAPLQAVRQIVLPPVASVVVYLELRSQAARIDSSLELQRTEGLVASALLASCSRMSAATWRWIEKGVDLTSRADRLIRHSTTGECVLERVQVLRSTRVARRCRSRRRRCVGDALGTSAGLAQAQRPGGVPRRAKRPMSARATCGRPRCREVDSSGRACQPALPQHLGSLLGTSGLTGELAGEG